MKHGDVGSSVSDIFASALRYVSLLEPVSKSRIIALGSGEGASCSVSLA